MNEQFIMDISYIGHSAFKIKGKTMTVVTDPYDERCGKFPRDIEAGIVTVSHQHRDHNQVDRVGGHPFVIEGPGEFEVGGVSVIGVASWHDDEKGVARGRNTIFVIEIDGLRVAHLGDLGHKLDQEQLAEMGPVDMLLVPVGGIYTLDAKTAAEVTKQADPWVVIPMHYQQPGLDKATFGQLTGVEVFLQEMGKTDIVPQAKFTITPDKLPQDLQVVVMERR